jgi:hypothetical protein
MYKFNVESCQLSAISYQLPNGGSGLVMCGFDLGGIERKQMATALLRKLIAES